MTPRSTVVLWKEIHEIADKVCKHFGFSYGKIVPETRKLTKHYGECRACPACQNADHIEDAHCKDKILYIRVHQLNNPKRPLATRTILHTLAHELAHLRVWYHGPEHRQLQQDVLHYMVELGYEVKRSG